jgi:hypothetical protein
MKRTAFTLAAVLAIIACELRGGEDERRERDERVLRELKARAARMSRVPANVQVSDFLVVETQRLIARSDALPRGSWEFRRLTEALDDLLDARQLLAEPRQNREDKDDREDTARRLERAYFRVQQGDYFARLTGLAQAPEYVLRSRQLYQQARSAYDRREYRQAVRLASASSELVNVLENLAQAAVRRPDPPVLR